MGPVTRRAPPVVIERPREGVGVVAMRHAREHNAMTPAFVRELSVALAEVSADPSLRCVVLTGLPEVFSAGASRALLRELARGEAAPADIVLPKLVLDLPIPVIAAMEGSAIGGGFALGCCADLVLIARESRYGLSFMNMGFTPGMGTTELLSHVLSPAIVSELLFAGEAKKGAWFEGRSGFNAILPREHVLPRALDLAARIAETPRLSLELLRRTLTLPRRRAFERTHTLETLMHRVSFAAPDVLERIEEHHAE